MFALVDCNNFYVSCERLFRPDLKTTPMIVLSNNDGCCIARSNEAKALGIKMGEPYFQIKALCKQHGVRAFSSNYTLYGDISQRVISTLEAAWPHIEIYSIDEAFLDVSSLAPHLHNELCAMLQKKILKDVGIPTSIGIGSTKTLAKVANHLAKKIFKIPVFNIAQESEKFLDQLSVGEVWGVGPRWSKKLIQLGVYTALDLANFNVHQLRKQFNVMLMNTAMELQGIVRMGLEIPAPNQSIMSSKSFGEMQTTFLSISESISSHCARAVEKLRQQNLVARKMYIFVQTNRFRNDLAQHFQGLEVKFISPTDDLRVVTKMAKKLLKQIFKAGYHYKKAGICLEDLIAKNIRQLDLFHHHSEEIFQKNERFMSIFDSINQKYGRSTIKLAAEGYSQTWIMKRELKSPAYTTRFSELALVKLE